MVKTIEEMDFYDLLNLRPDASSKDIENAYLLAVATYHQDGLASYGALGDLDRRSMLDKIEKAFQTLSDPEKKKDYDLRLLPGRPEFRLRAHFRSSTSRLEIEDASEEKPLLDKDKAVANRPWRRSDNHKRSKNGHRQEGLPEDFYYYGDYLKKVRERRGLSPEDIAERCGISPDRVKSLEKENPPLFPHEEERLEGLKLYAKCLGLGSEDGRASPLSDRFDE